MKTPPTATQVAKMKNAAKELARAGTATHTEALDQLARAAGYEGWREVTQLRAHSENLPRSDFPIDPQLPPEFDNTRNEDRSDEELDRWWMQPFLVTRPDGTYDVRALDGGCWDRSTWYGNAKTVEEAKQIAAAKLAKWAAWRDQPKALLNDGVILAILEETRPRMPKPIVGAYGMGRTQAWFDSWSALTDAERASRAAAARHRADNLPDGLEIEELAFTDRLTDADGRSPGHDVVGICLLLWRWAPSSTKAVRLSLAELRHYLEALDFYVELDEVRALVEKACACTVASGRGATASRAPLARSCTIASAADDPDVVECVVEITPGIELEHPSAAAASQIRSGRPRNRE